MSEAPINVTLPSGCGNAPRVEIVAAWAGRDAEALGRWLNDDAEWRTAGGGTVRGARGVLDDLAGRPPVDRVDLESLITHGREASCHGVLASGGVRTEFALALRFRSTGKTAPLVRVTEFVAPEGPNAR